MHIRYTLADCPLGRLLLAATDQGISALALGDDDRVLEQSLAQEYPHAQLTRDDTALGTWLVEVLEYLHGRQSHLDLPLDVQATAYQHQVWEELRKIPPGTTRTYSDIARRMGQAKAMRAVARACATNPVSLVVPCHRVVREDGGLGGYRWGLERKQMLLDRERGEG